MATKKLYHESDYPKFKERYGKLTAQELQTKRHEWKQERIITGTTNKQIISQHLQMLERLLREQAKTTATATHSTTLQPTRIATDDKPPIQKIQGIPEPSPIKKNATAVNAEEQITATASKKALIVVPSPSLPQKAKGQALTVPAIITNEGKKTTKRFLEFFTANIRNPNTRASYVRAISQFLTWCDELGVTLEKIEPMVVASYIEKLTQERSAQTVKQSLAGIRMLFDWLVVGQVLPFNPASSVRGPKYSYKKGKTPVLPVDEMRRFLERIDTSSLLGLRDRALIGLMVYSFARVSAVVGMKVKDYYANGKRHFVGLHEKGGKYHEVPVHHKAEDFLDVYLAEAGIAGDKNAPLFQSAGGKGRKLTGKALSRFDAWAIVKKRALEAGVTAEISPHSFRATGITAYLENGGTIEHAQQIACHESPRTTKLYDRTNDQITLDEIERIGI